MGSNDLLPFELDAREILRYLNELGIKNISGTALRDFITDLKRLIIYDLYYKDRETDDSAPEAQGPERLHSASTFCSRLRSRRHDQPVGCCKDSSRRRDPIRNAVSAPLLREKVEVPQRRACSCTRVERDEKEATKRRKVLASSTSSNLIKVPISQPQKKSDPVSLYHYYTTLWNKYKSNVPGENSWADLRWNIRQKLAGEVQKTNKKKVTQPTPKELEKRRQGWVE